MSNGAFHLPAVVLKAIFKTAEKSILPTMLEAARYSRSECKRMVMLLSLSQFETASSIWCRGL